MDKRWIPQAYTPEVPERLSQEPIIMRNGTTKTIPLSIAKLLASIGITTGEEMQRFLVPSASQIHSPFLLTDMQKAVDRINRAIDNNERILGFGDYDCDGVTSTALLKEGLALLGADIEVFAPNRFKDGYGLNPLRMKEFAHRYDLIISADTGIRAFSAAKILNEENGADLIVTDHHEPHIVPVHEPDASAVKEGATHEVLGDEMIYLPDCYAVIDQQRLGDAYPFKSLAGVGIAFKLLQALFISRKSELKPLLMLLDFVATGTIADLAKQADFHNGKLDFENRVLCTFGISLMNIQPKPWVKAISLATGIRKAKKEDGEEEDFLMSEDQFFDLGTKVDSTSIGFRIGPLLNAPGRLDDPKPAVNLLLEKDPLSALNQAKSLRSVNAKRQEETKSHLEIIKELESSDPSYTDYGIVVRSELFHIGIAGLVAGKLQNHYYRPSIALAPIEKDGITWLKGSARSIPGVHMLRCLDYVKSKIGDYVYGGHAPAAGLSIEINRFDDFRSAFREACMQYPKELFTPSLTYQAALDLEEVDDKMMGFLDLFEPYGEGMFKSDTKKPLFRTDEVKITGLRPIMDGKGCILTLKHRIRTYKGVMFADGERVKAGYDEAIRTNKIPFVNLLYSPEWNEWNNQRTIQLMIVDLQFSR